MFLNSKGCVTASALAGRAPLAQAKPLPPAATKQKADIRLLDAMVRETEYCEHRELS